MRHSCTKNRKRRKSGAKQTKQNKSKVLKKNVNPKSTDTKSYNTLKRKDKKANLSIQKNTFEPYNYEEIHKFLCNLYTQYPCNIQMEVIGNSQEGRPIYLVIVAANCSELPKNAVFIEAGCNGEDLVAVGCALYMVEQLVRKVSDVNNLKIMDYLIVPCSNPDAFVMAKSGKKPKKNLTHQFPFKIGRFNIDDIEMKHFIAAAKTWKLNFESGCPEKLVILKVLRTYQFAIKLVLSLQEEGLKIAYPYGVTSEEVYDIEDIRKVASAGRSGSSLSLQIGSIYQLFGLKFGTIIDFLSMFQTNVRFCYIIHINDKSSPCEPKDIPNRTKDILNCIKLMSQEVCELYEGQIPKDNGSSEEIQLKKIDPL